MTILNQGLLMIWKVKVLIFSSIEKFLSNDLKSESGKFEFACVKCNLSFKMIKDLKAKAATSGYSGRQIFQLSTNILEKNPCIWEMQLLFASFDTLHWQETFVRKQCVIIGSIETHMLVHHTGENLSAAQCDYSCMTYLDPKSHCAHIQEKSFHLEKLQLL